MTPVSLDKLEESIIKPGMEKHLIPLVAYRGRLTVGQAHRMLNLTVAAMEQDCSFADLTQRLQHNPDFSHLCGPEKVKQSPAFYSFFARLEANPNVANNIPHLLDYVRGLGRHRIDLTPVSLDTRRSRNMGAGGWRSFDPLRRGRTKTTGERAAERPQLVYPFLIHDGGKPEHILLRKVNAAIPRHFSPDLRADMCQDLIVGILCGDFAEDDLLLPAKEMTRKVLKMFPTKYGPFSLDAKIGDTNLTLLDTLSDDMNPWEMMETM